MKKIYVILLVLLMVCSACATNNSPAPVSASTPAKTVNDAVFANRQKMKIEGVDNIRDIGGYTTTNGKVVKTGLLYRADALGKATPAGIQALGELNIGYIFDLREDGEINRRPDPEINGAAWLHTEIPTSAISPTKPQTYEEVRTFYSDPETLDYWKKGYEYMLVSTKARESLKTILGTALNDDGRKALVWHCSGGKDRTGYISAVFLSLLGVDDATIVKEYLLTNDDRRAFDEKELIDMDKNYFKGNVQMTEGFLSIQQARAEYVSIFLSGLRRLYGTVDNYLMLEIGFTQAELDKIRAAYTK